MSKQTLKFATPLEGALFCARHGLAVFPLRPNTKQPAFKGWQMWATTSIEKITAYGEEHPDANWAAYCDVSRIMVADVDNKKGRNGSQSIRRLKSTYGEFLDTLVVKTPNDGYHLYYSGLTKSGGSELAKLGIDVKSRGGYVVAPGSRIDSITYDIIRNGAIAPLPEWLASMANTSRKAKSLEPGEKIHCGNRNNFLTSIAGSMRSRGLEYNAILAALLVANDEQLVEPLDDREVEVIAESVSKYEPSNVPALIAFQNTSVVEFAEVVSAINIATLPKRDWIMKNRYVGGFVSMIVSPGGVGKSTLSMLDALAIVTGKPLSGFDVLRGGAVWVYNTEDTSDELKRRFAATAMHHQIPIETLSNLYFTSGIDRPFVIAKDSKDGVLFNEEAIEDSIEFIRKNNVRLMVVDPLVKTYDLPENDNSKMDKVISSYQRIATATGCAICLVHHASKAGSNPTAERGDMNISRGASALVNAARIVHTVSIMTPSEAKKLGVLENERCWYLRLDSAKANMNAPAVEACWFRKINVMLPNTDAVGTVERINLKNSMETKKEKAMDVLRDDVGWALTQLMGVESSMSLAEACKIIHNQRRFSHILEDIDNPNYKKEKLRLLLEAGITYQGRLYALKERNGSPKYFIQCTSAGLPRSGSVHSES